MEKSKVVVIPEETEKIRFKISKHYERKVSLKHVSSQYDNISCGTFISAEIDWKDQEDLDKKIASLSEKVFKETERDMAMAMKNLMEIASDTKNSAIVGKGGDLELKRFLSSQIEGLEDLFAKDTTKIDLPPDFSEVDIEL